MLVTQQFDRFKDAPWVPKSSEPVVIGGAGGIGSWLAFFLTRIGFTCYVYDDDKIEEHNLGGQLFRASDIGKYKVEALQNIVNTFCNDDLNALTQRVTENTSSHHFMFSAFDNMKARRDMFNVWKKSLPGTDKKPIFIDGRLELEQLQIFAITEENMDEYEKVHLFDDSRVEEAACTMKQSSHTAALIASTMSVIFTNHMANIYEGEAIRDVPFFYEFTGPMMLTRTEYA